MKKWLAVFALGMLLSGPANALLRFESQVVVSPFGDGDNWLLVDELEYRIHETDSMIKLRPGFVTDFASVPRPFWWALPTWGQYGPAAIAHDFLYWDQQCTRKQADEILLAAMKDSDVWPPWRSIIYAGVRI